MVDVVFTLRFYYLEFFYIVSSWFEYHLGYGRFRGISAIPIGVIPGQIFGKSLNYMLFIYSTLSREGIRPQSSHFLTFNRFQSCKRVSNLIILDCYSLIYFIYFSYVYKKFYGGMFFLMITEKCKGEFQVACSYYRGLSVVWNETMEGFFTAESKKILKTVCFL